jgi:hypothetical protein
MAIRLERRSPLMERFGGSVGVFTLKRDKKPVGSLDIFQDKDGTFAIEVLQDGLRVYRSEINAGQKTPLESMKKAKRIIEAHFDDKIAFGIEPKPLKVKNPSVLTRLRRKRKL